MSLLVSSAAQATITLATGFNAGSAQHGADATDLSSHATLPTIACTAIVPVTLENTTDGSSRLNDGLYADPTPAYIPTEDFNINTTPPLSGSFNLVFGSPTIVGEIAVNPRYGNRHAGDYTIRDDAGAIRGRFTSSGATCRQLLCRVLRPFQHR